MADRSYELGVAIYAALSGDATLSSLLGGAGRVFDTVPSGTPAPYVVIGEETASDAGRTLAADAQEHTLTIHVWTEEKSSKPCKQIAARVRAILHGNPPALSAGTCTNLRCEFKETMRDPDGVSWHGVLRFRAATQG